MAGESIAEATVTLRGDGAQLEGDVTRVVGNIGKAIAGLAVAKGAFDFVKEGVARLGEMEVTAARTNAVIKSTGGIANVTASSIENFGHKIQDTIGVQGDLVQSGENVLLKYTAIRNEVGKGNDIFNQARDAMVDLSVATGKDMASSAAILGKALQDPEKGMTALKKAGVNLTEQQKAAIVTFTETGDVLSAQKIILDAVNDTVGGSAKAFGETLPAKMAVAQQKFADMRAEVASAFLPAIEFGAQAVGFLSDKIQELPGPLSAALVGTVGLGAGLGAVAGPLNEVINLGGSVADTYKSVDQGLRNAGLGGVAATAGFVGLTAVVAGTVLGGLKLAGAFDDLFVSSDNLAVKSVPKLVTQFQNLKTKGDEVGNSLESNNSKAGIVTLGIDKLGQSIGNGAVTLDRFRSVAEKNVVTAGQLALHMVDLGIAGEGTGISVAKLNEIIAANSVKVAEARGVTQGSAADLAAWGAAFTTAAAKVEDAKVAVDNFKIGIEASIGPTLGALGANISFQEQVDKLTESLFVNGATFDLNEQAGRNNAAMLGQLVADSISSTEQTIRLTGAQTGSAEAMDIAKFKATELANGIIVSGSAAGQSAEQMVRYAGDIGLIPPEAVTEILNNADVQAGLVQYFSGVLAGVDGQTANTSITNTITTIYRSLYYNSPGAMWAGQQEAANQGYYYAHGGIAGAKRGMITRGPALRIIGEAGPEAVVPLGNTATNRSDRSAVMAAAGLSSDSGWSDARVVSMLATTNALLAKVIANQQQGPPRPGPSRAIVGGRR